MSEICLTTHSLACIVLNMSILNKLFIRNYLTTKVVAYYRYDSKVAPKCFNILKIQVECKEFYNE